MLPEADAIRLRHMLDAALEALNFARGRMRADLDTDRQFCLSVIREIEIIGEAANAIAPATQQAYPHFPWPAIIAMRNRLIHAYFDIDLDRVWDTLTVDLPELVTRLQGIMSGEKQP